MYSSLKEDREQSEIVRKTTNMEESNDMTIEFLRARLLSERSVSKSARQRAEELAKRVAELEEQLKFVSLQRKKAEKATNDVLAILENHGISDDVSEEFDSSSEQEESLHDFKDYNGSSLASTNVKLRKNEMDAYSSSEIESSPSTGRSLSWKSTKDPQRSLDKKKYMDSVSRRASFSSNSSSARTGKSCSRIRHRETRSIEELQTDSAEKTAFSRDVSNCSESEPVAPRESSAYKNLKLGSNNEIQKSNGHYSNVHEIDDDMESALQHQAQLIGRYEEEEKVQREWEEKFRENNSGTQDSCDPGNHSDVTEERYETKSPELSCGDGAMSSDNRETMQEKSDAYSSGPHTSNSLPSSTDTVDKGDSQHEKSANGIIAGKSSPPDFSFHATKEKSNQEFPKEQPSSADKCQQCVSHSHPFPHSSEAAKSRPQSASLRSSSSLQLAVVPQETPNNLGSVLEALQQAKLSLNQKLNSVPQVAGGITSSNAINPSNPAANTVNDSFLIPVGSLGLFRLPTDFQSESAIAAISKSGSTDARPSFSSFQSERFANSRSALGYTDARPRLSSFQSQPFADSRIAFGSTDARPSSASFQSEAIATSKRSFTDVRPSLASFQSEPFTDYSRSASQGDLFLTAPNRSFAPESRPAVGDGPHPYNRTNYLDPYMNPNLPLVNDSYPFLPDVTLRLPLEEEGASRPSSSSERGIPPYMRLSSYDERYRPNMYR